MRDNLYKDWLEERINDLVTNGIPHLILTETCVSF